MPETAATVDAVAVAVDALTVDKVRRLEFRLEREREKTSILENMIEERSRSLYLAQEEMRDQKAYLESILRSLVSALIITYNNGTVVSVGGATRDLTKRGSEEIIGRPVSEFISFADPADGLPLSELSGTQHEGELLALDGSTLPALINVSRLRNDEGREVGFVFLATDMSERRQLEVELRHAQRLESIGQLAAGVAHEINTPIQFVGDSARFLGDVITDIVELLDTYHGLRALAETAGLDDAVAAVDDKADEIDLEFLLEEAPKAVDRTIDGVARIATIVKALKQFSHPGGEHMAPADLNEIIETTLIVAKNEYKYVADVKTELGPIPETTCHRGDIAQVMLNLVVNAAQALTDLYGGTETRGRIAIRSSLVEDGKGVLIEVEDTGGGIPEAIRHRVFEPFFTTKDVGKGTGQGLALAHNVIVSKHKGRLSFVVEEGVGTTFRVWLPVGGGM